MKTLNRNTGVADRSILSPALLACVGALGMLLSLVWSAHEPLVRPLSAAESMRIVGAMSQGGTFPHLDKRCVGSNFTCPAHDGTVAHCTSEASVGQPCYHCNSKAIQITDCEQAEGEQCNAVLNPPLADCPKRVVGVCVMHGPDDYECEAESPSNIPCPGTPTNKCRVT
jgi:hypothetical protein